MAELMHKPFSCNAAVTLIAACDGIGGLRRSAERLKLQVFLYVGIELEAPCKRVKRAAYEGTIEISGIKEIDRRALGLVIDRGRHAGGNLCLHGGGFPCQDVSRSHAGHHGISGRRSSLFFELCRVARDVVSL